MIVNLQIRNGGQIISLETVIPADDGHYECVARNKLGSVRHTYELDVQGMLAIGGSVKILFTL